MRSVLVVNLPSVVDLLVSLVGYSLPPLHVMTANTGREALDLIRRRSEQIDLAIVNSELIDLTWLEMTRSLEKALPETPIVVSIPGDKAGRAGKVERLGHRVLWQPIEEKGLQGVVVSYLSPGGL